MIRFAIMKEIIALNANRPTYFLNYLGFFNVQKETKTVAILVQSKLSIIDT